MIVMVVAAVLAGSLEDALEVKTSQSEGLSNTEDCVCPFTTHHYF